MKADFINANKKEGYFFNGWYQDEKLSGDKIITEELKEVTVNENRNFYGQFVKVNPPTAITLSANVIEENQTIGTLIGNLISTDVEAGETFTYSLVAGVGADNSRLQH